MKTYDIATLDPSPSMSYTKVQFTGTFKQAVKAAHASYAKSGRSTTVFDHIGSYPWYHISCFGEVTNNNEK